MGKSPHHIQSTGDFVSKAKGLTFQPGECLSSYDVTSLFTSVPIDPALKIIRDLLEKDEKLNDITVLSVQNIIELLGFCLYNTHFSFQNKFYEQVEGAPMGSPVSPTVTNLYMECFEKKALASAINPPWLWYRFVDDTWVLQKQAHKQAFLDHINSMDPAIKFTVKGTRDNGAIPFLDTLVTPLVDNSLSFQVYCKPTHTNQYLQRDNHHSLSFKYSVIGTLTQRAKVVCTNSELLQGELNHLRSLGKCNYPTWAINRVQQKVLSNNWEDTSNNSTNASITRDNNSNTTNNNQGSNPNTTRQGNMATVRQIAISYTKGIAESIKQTCGMYDIQVHFKGNSTASAFHPSVGR